MSDLRSVLQQQQACRGTVSDLGTYVQGRAVSREALAGDSRMERVTAAIISGALSFSAADAFDAFTRLNELKCAARVQMARVDFLVVPSAAHHYTVAGRAPSLPSRLGSCYPGRKAPNGAAAASMLACAKICILVIEMSNLVFWRSAMADAHCMSYQKLVTG